MLYKILNIKNPEYNPLKIEKQQLLYAGGDDILDKASLFLNRELMESNTSWLSRIKSASYKNYMSEIINNYTAELFNKTIAIRPAVDSDDNSTPGEDNIDFFYDDFFKDADLKGNSLTNVIKQVLSESIVTSKAYIQIDFPKSDIRPQTLFEENQLGTARAYLINISTLAVIDWHKCDQTGLFDFLVIKSEYSNRRSLEDNRKEKTIRFKVWKKENSIVSWEIYEFTTNREIRDEDEFQLVDSGVVSFSEIPVMCLETPSELCIGNSIGNLCIDHFRRSSSLIFAQNRNLFSIPVFKQGNEVSSTGSLSTIAEDGNRGEKSAKSMKQRGFAIIGPEDDIFFAEPKVDVYALVSKQLEELAEEIHKITHVMAKTVSQKQSSGLSKMMDSHDKEIVLTAFGELLKSFFIKMYTVISKARNENIKWSVQGLDDFKLVLDREQLLNEITSLDLINVPSKTFKKAMYTQLATNFIENLSHQEQLVIKAEISEGVDKMKEEELYHQDMNEDKVETKVETK